MERFLGIAAGIIKTHSEVPKGLVHLVDHITFGSFTLKQREGNVIEPTYYFDEVKQMSMNAIGLKNQGLSAFLKEDLPRLLDFSGADATIRISLAPLEQGDVHQMIDILNRNSLVAKMRCEVEINAACPNHWKKGTLQDVTARDPDALECLMREGVHFTGKKSIKIAPDMEYVELEKCIELAIAYGYYAIVSGNTRREKTPLDAQGRKVLSLDSGGIGGKPLFEGMIEQLKKLREIIQNLETRQGPEIIACGGVMDAPSAKKVLEVGAERFQVATYYAKYRTNGIRDLMNELI